jgi:hypothetical protein
MSGAAGPDCADSVHQLGDFLPAADAAPLLIPHRPARDRPRTPASPTAASLSALTHHGFHGVAINMWVTEALHS